MSEKNFLTAEKREKTKNSARDVRAKNRVPGIIYGSKITPISVSVAASEILKIFRKAGTSSLVDLEIDKKKIKVLLHEILIHPVKNVIWHVDFLAIDEKKKTTVEVPLKFIGTSPAVKNLGGVFIAKYNSIEIRCLPTDIPKKIEIDISKLENLHDHICAKDLPIDCKKMELMHIDPEIVICSIIGRATEEEKSETKEETEETKTEETAEKTDEKK